MVVAEAEQVNRENGSKVLELALDRPRARIDSRDGEHRLVAIDAISPGEPLLWIEGLLSSAPCRLSVQIGRNLHIAPPPGLQIHHGPDRYLWRFLNHSCYPNARLNRQVLIALHPIARGEEITFDYNANEYDMATPFICKCGQCQGELIRGYRHLTKAQRAARRDHISEHLRGID